MSLARPVQVCFLLYRPRRLASHCITALSILSSHAKSHHITAFGLLQQTQTETNKFHIQPRRRTQSLLLLPPSTRRTRLSPFGNEAGTGTSQHSIALFPDPRPTSPSLKGGMSWKEETLQAAALRPSSSKLPESWASWDIPASYVQA